VTAVEALKTAQRASLAELDALFATLQHRAFVCVCPSCHVRLDYHAVLIEPARLRVRPGHDVAKRFIDHHNKLVRQLQACLDVPNESI
jgi:hypothetical protein